jgi:predicted methyltransferase
MRFVLSVLTLTILAALGGCDRFAPSTQMSDAPIDVKDGETAEKPPIGSMPWALAGEWRGQQERERDVWRHPGETLAFWGLKPDMRVVEVLPGRGWYTAVLAPYLNAGGGSLLVAQFEPVTDAQRDTLAAFDKRFADAKLFGAIDRATLSARSGPLGPANSADMVILARNMHTLLSEGYAEKAFADFYAVLKPGGILGVEQHRAASTGLQDPQASNGYVQEAYVKLFAAEAGFEFIASSEINANARDDRDHPFGVWTLPPALRTAPLGLDSDPSFDTAPFEAIGESDRMTLKFRKPGGAPLPPLPKGPEIRNLPEKK